MGRKEMASGLLAHGSGPFDGLHSSAVVLSTEEQRHTLTYKTLA